MRRSESIVNRLLEAGPVLMPAGSVLAIKNDVPKIFQKQADFYQWLGQGHVDNFLASGGAYLVRDNSGKVRLYSQRIPLNMRPETTDYVLQTFGLAPNSASGIAYSTGPDRPVVSKSLADILPRPQWEPAPVEKTKPVKEPETEPPLKSGVPTRQQESAGQQELGVSFLKGTQGGLLVRHVERGSAAAKAGVQPNDVIVAVGEYTNTSGVISPSARIQNAEQMRHVLKLHQPQTVLPLMVRRGSGIVELPVVPAPAKTPQPSPQQQALPQEPPQLTRPNEPDPASKTGNPPTPSAMRNYY